MKLWDDEGGNKCNLEDPPYPPPPAPSATTEGATGITATEATVAGSVNPNGPDAHYYFEYGPTNSYGTKIPTPPGNNVGFGETAVPVSVKYGPESEHALSLSAVASSWVGTTDGVDQTFRTPDGPSNRPRTRMEVMEPTGSVVCRAGRQPAVMRMGRTRIPNTKLSGWSRAGTGPRGKSVYAGKHGRPRGRPRIRLLPLGQRMRGVRMRGSR